MFSSCAHYSTTQQNIKKVNAAFEIKNPKSQPPAAVQTPAQKTVDEAPGAIPLSQFLDARTHAVLQSVNPWFSKLQDWSRVYVDIAKSERDVRNFELSEKYSTTALLWAHRALQIKDLPTEGAVFKVNLWIDQIQWPELPETSSYYAGQDVYEKIVATKNILKGFQKKFCMISHGVPIIPTLAYLELSIDLFKQKKYSKALYKIQSGLASVENIKPEEDKKCELTDDKESPDSK